jgi:hypothetical protein
MGHDVLTPEQHVDQTFVAHRGVVNDRVGDVVSLLGRIAASETISSESDRYDFDVSYHNLSAINPAANP